MVRPRLVEEGNPLTEGVNGDESGSSGDHTMLDESAPSPSSPPAMPVAVMSIPNSTSACTSSSSASSLARALSQGGGRNGSWNAGRCNHRLTAEPRTRRTSYRTVIGRQDDGYGGCEYASSLSAAHTSLPDYSCWDDAHPGRDHVNHARHFHRSSQNSHPATTASRIAQERTQPHRTHFEIGRMDVDGSDHHDGDEDRSRLVETTSWVTRMEGVEDHGVPSPLVVIDGANVAYEYVSSSSSPPGTGTRSGASDARGMLVAAEYFEGLGLRVRVVLPASWFRRKPNEGDPDRSNAAMHTEQTDALLELKRRGMLVASPPADDDDAYALALARREAARVSSRYKSLLLLQGPPQDDDIPTHLGGAFVVSNDWFRDAQRRDSTLRPWLEMGEVLLSDGRTRAALSPSSSVASSPLCPGRISYTFADLGAMDDGGEPLLDFVPNPRHPFVSWAERQHRLRHLDHH